MKAKVKKRRLRTLEELWAIEDEFPLAFAPDPVHLSLKWGIPLSKSYLKFKEQQLRAEKRRERIRATGKRGLVKARQRKSTK